MITARPCTFFIATLTRVRPTKTKQQRTRRIGQRAAVFVPHCADNANWERKCSRWSFGATKLTPKQTAHCNVSSLRWFAPVEPGGQGKHEYQSIRLTNYLI